MARYKKKRPFALRRALAVLGLAALVIGTLPMTGFRPQAGSTFNDYEQGLVSAGFPESYVHLLSRLHDRHPSWHFEPFHTGLNWAAAVAAECSAGRSLVVSTAGDAFKSKAAGCYDPATGAYTFVESGYVTASEFAVSYYMDPRNFLRDEYILQFESLVYHAASNELGVIQSILSGSVLDRNQIVYKTSAGADNTIDISYAQAILEAGQTYGVNPYYLASKIRNEVGSGGATISGTVDGYRGLYNFYNIYAYGASSVQQSLAWAGSGSSYSRPWTTPVRSIHGGAEYIARGYLDRGQTTSYFQRFNVVNQPYYSHQYMTAISGAAEEACNTYRALSADVLGAERTFVIPVYENMPQSATYLADSISLQNYYNTGVANATVNLRTAPTTDAGKSGVLPEGSAVTILEEARSSGTDFLKYPYWYRVSYGGGQEGYVCANYINVSYTQTTLEAGGTLQLQYLLSPAGAAESPVVSSSNNAVATVNSTGTVVGVGVGTAYITATVNNGDRVTTCLSVVPSTTGIVAVTELVLNAENLSLGSGETYQLAAEIFPQDATFKTVHWSSNNTSVVTVGSEDGLVQAIGGGSAVVVGASADGGVYAVCHVTVNAPVLEEPESQTGGLVDLETSLEQVQQTIAQLQEAIAAAEKLDLETAGLLQGELPELPEVSETPSDIPLPDPDALAPGLEDDGLRRPAMPNTQTTSFTVQVAHPDGSAADDAAVLLKSSSDKIVSNAHFVTDGQYIFENILNGSYTVEVTAADGQVYRQDIQLQSGVLSGDTAFVLQPPQQHGKLGFYLALGAVSLAVLALVAVGVIGRLKRKRSHARRKWYRSM